MVGTGKVTLQGLPKCLGHFRDFPREHFLTPPPKKNVRKQFFLWMVSLVFLTPVVGLWMVPLVFLKPAVGLWMVPFFFRTHAVGLWMVTLVFVTPAGGCMVTLVFLTPVVG